MEGYVPEIRLKSGYLEFKNDVKLNFQLGLVFLVEGNYYIELHFPENLDLEQFYNKYQDTFVNSECEIVCTTDDPYACKITRVWMKSFSFHKFSADFYCIGHIQIEKSLYSDIPDFDEHENNIHYVKLDGFKTSHCNNTQVQTNPQYLKSPRKFSRTTWDHTEASFTFQGVNYQFIIQHDDDDESRIHFLHDEQTDKSLSFEIWDKLRLDFIEFLSFINGAMVIIKAEYFGQYSGNKLDAQIRRLYSKQDQKTTRRNDFFPIRDVGTRQYNIIANMFGNNFEKYRNMNDTMELNAVIFYLNHAEKTSSVGQKLFVQTIILEMISDNYANTLSGTQTVLIDQSIFDPIKEELMVVLEKHRNSLGTKFNLINSKLANLNHTSRKQTDFKFRQLIEGVGIPIDDNIEKLLIARHDIIHRGDIGTPEVGIKHYKLIDRLIRLILVKLIKYSGPISAEY